MIPAALVPVAIPDDEDPSPEEITAAERLLAEAIGAIGNRKGPKRVAALSGRKGANAHITWNAAIARRDGNAPRLSDMLAAAAVDDTGAILAVLEEVLDAEITPRCHFTDAQKLTRAYKRMSKYLSAEAIADVRGYAEGRR